MTKKTTLVIGASLNPERYSNMAIKSLVANNQHVLAYGLKVGDVSGVTISTILEEYNTIDTVTLYLNPALQKVYYDYIIGLKPRRVIFNPGTENPEFYNLLKANAIAVEIACTLVLLSTNQY